MTTQIKSRMLATEPAAERANLAPGTMRNLRVTGEGPAFYKVRKRVYYDPADIDAWLEAKRVTSTTQKVAA